ncbi:MAG TPA: DUF3455 domain-containing protein [Kofleriaceae bacterium]
MRWMMYMALAACGGSQTTARPGPMATSSDHARPQVAPELAVPDAAKLVLVANARGVQIYECAPDGWKLHAPRADLLDDAGVAIGQHYGGVDRGKPAGPWWEAKDGSSVHGANPASVANPGSIPLLRLDGSGATFTGDGGLLSSVAFIQRLATTGGVAPAGACAAGQTSEVPYTATYYFYTKG